jgi:hypothetical protein
MLSFAASGYTFFYNGVFNSSSVMYNWYGNITHGPQSPYAAFLAINRTARPFDGLIVYIPFDITNSSYAMDLSGNFLDAVISGATSSSTAKFNSSMSFDGSNDYVYGNQGIFPATTVNRTVCFWLYDRSGFQYDTSGKYFSYGASGSGNLFGIGSSFIGGCAGTPGASCFGSPWDCSTWNADEPTCIARSCTPNYNDGCVDNLGLDCASMNHDTCVTYAAGCADNHDDLCGDNPSLDCASMNHDTCVTYAAGCADNHNYGCGDNLGLDCSGMNEGTCTIYSSGCTVAYSCQYGGSNSCIYPDCADCPDSGTCDSCVGSSGYWLFSSCSTTGSCASFNAAGCPDDYGCDPDTSHANCTTSGSCASFNAAGCPSGYGCLPNTDHVNCSNTGSCASFNAAGCPDAYGCDPDAAFNGCSGSQPACDTQNSSQGNCDAMGCNYNAGDCGLWVGDQAGCELYGSRGGECTWYANGNCEGSHSGCDTWDADESGCITHGCTPSYAYTSCGGSHNGCSSYSGTDQGTCESHGCTWSDPDCTSDPHVCSSHDGSESDCTSAGCTPSYAFSDCSGSPHDCGSHNSDQGTCESMSCTYYVGNCTGTLTCANQQDASCPTIGGCEAANSFQYMSFFGGGLNHNATNLNITQNTWHFVAATYNGTDVTLYLDGAKNITSKALTTSVAGDSWKLGCQSSGSGGCTYYSNMIVDDFMFFNRSLEPTELNDIANATIPRFLPNGNFTYNLSLAGAGKINVTLTDYLNSSGTNFTLRVAEGYVANFTNGMVTNYDLTGLTGLNNANITIYFNTNSSSRFYTPTLWNSVLINWTVLITDNDLPSIDFVAPMTTNGSVTRNTTAYVNMTINDTYDHYAFVNFNDSLVAWMTFDDVNSSGMPGDRSTSGNNGTKSSGASMDQYGKYNNSFNFNGNNGLVSIGNSNLPSGSRNRTAALWFKINSGTSGGLFSYGSITTAGNQFSLEISGSKLYFWGHGRDLAGTATLSAGTWYHAVVVYNGTSVQLYLNGANDGSSVQSLNTVVNTTAYLGYAVHLSYFNGEIDEFMVFNRTLNQSEILALYNASGAYRNNFTNLNNGNITVQGFAVDLSGNVNQTGILGFLVDNTAPAVRLFSPNASYFNTSTINIRYIASDNGQLDTVWYNYTSGNVTLTGNTSITGTEGANNLTLWANDTVGNYNSSVATVRIDTQPPNMTVHNASGLSLGYSSSVKIQGNCSDTGTAGVQYAWTNSTYFRTANGTFNNISNGYFNLSNSSAIPDGTFTVYVMCNDSYNNLASSAFTFTFSTKTPRFAWIASIPNSTETDYIDPFVGFAVMANVSDFNGTVDSAILQWKNSTAADWTNYTMTNQTAKITSAQFNYTMPLPYYQDNFTYRIVANNTAGYTNTSSTSVNVSSFWDCTWNITNRTFDTASGWDTNKYVGTININNTGDSNYTSGSNCTLYYRLTYDLTEGRIYFDDLYFKPSTLYTITAGNNRTIAVNATFLSEVKEDTPTITVTDASSRSTTNNINVTSTLISTTGGAYLYSAIPTYPTTVNLTTQNISLSAYIRNVMGDDTAGKSAYNVSFNWSLPSGFLLTDGNLSFWQGNMTNNSPVYDDINISLNSTNLPSMTAGNNSLTIYYAASNNTAGPVLNANGQGLQSRTVYITTLCYNTSDSVCVTSCGNTMDPDCNASTTTTVTSSSTGGGGGGSVLAGTLTKAQSEALLRSSESQVDLTRGTDNSFTITITNPLDQALTDVTIELSGFIASKLSLETSKIPYLAPGESVEVTVHVEAPKYLSPGRNDITFTVKGKTKIRGVSADFKETRSVALLVQDMPRSDAENYYNSTSGILEQFRSLGFPTAGMESLFSQIKTALFSTRDYSAVKDLYEQATKLLDDAKKANETIAGNNALIAQSEHDGIPTPKTQRLNNLAAAAFERGEFALALARADEAAITYALETKGEFNLGMFLYNNWPGVSLGTAVSLFALVVVFFRVKLSIVKHRLKMIDKEEFVLLGLIKELQKECFEKAKMSMEEYMQAVLGYEERLSKAVQTRIELETQRVRLARWWKTNLALYQERDRLLQLMKQTQSEYMEEGKIETHVYENRMKSLKERLSVVEEKISMKEASQAIRKKMGTKVKFFK